MIATTLNNIVTEWGLLELNKDIIYLSILTLTIILLTFFLSLLEASILCIDDFKISMLKEKHPKKEKIFNEIMRSKQKYLSAVVVLNTIVSIMGSTILGALSSAYFGSILVLFYSLSLTYLILTISKILPKLLAIKHSLTIFNKSAYLIKFIFFLSAPVLWTTKITTFWLKLNTIKNINNHEEEFHSIINYYKNKGVIHNTEKNVFEKVMKMKSKKADEFYSKGTETIELKNFDINSNDINSHFNGAPRKIIITYKKKPIGVLYNKDISKAIAYDNGITKIINIMRNPIIISKDDNLFEVVNRLNTENKTVAVVLNEENTPIGVLTPKVIYRYLLKNVNLLSNIDFDTGVLTRKKLIEKIKQTFEITKKSSTGTFSILFLNIKNFSEYNEKYGYHQGDVILKEMISLIKKQTPEDSDIGRLGEGFGIVLYSKNESESDNILKNIDESLKIKDIKIKGKITEYSSDFINYLDMIGSNNKKTRNKFISEPLV